MIKLVTSLPKTLALHVRFVALRDKLMVCMPPITLRRDVNKTPPAVQPAVQVVASQASRTNTSLIGV